MPTTTDRPTFAGWLKGHATPLMHLDPTAPLDDLEPLRDLLGSARVVGLGEHSHFIDEFAVMRQRILRFLVERCGFTVLAFEYGFCEALPLDAWARGSGTDDDLSALLANAVPIGLQDPLRFLRRHNRTATEPVRFAGIDIPAAGGSLLPALTPVTDYLRQIDPEALPALQSVTTIAASFAGDSAAVAAPAWARLSTNEQDTLSALLARLLIRFRALKPLYLSRGDRNSYDTTLRCLEAACHGDYTFRAMAGLFAGDGLTADTSARDLYMAESLLWHLDRLKPTDRVVLMAHNAHLQKTPIAFDGHLTGLPMGQHLHHALGDAYFALGLTSITGHTADMRRDETAPFGFTVHEHPAGATRAGKRRIGFRRGRPWPRRRRSSSSPG
ncbi:erythromycin esterase family protein [Streptomyces sp. NPDC090231]|uniref:erythromycin esterase family protein n=1 Tax=unclassified Streptomyces TaxID=2593676 RepID=UPI0038246B2C